jgi:hypothetical protein
VDAVLELLRKYALAHSLDPLAVPDMEQKFTVVSCKGNTRFAIFYISSFKTHIYTEKFHKQNSKYLCFVLSRVLIFTPKWTLN